jgi:hypothetical protein
MSENCKYLEHCPIWENLADNLKFVWIKIYCQGDKQSECKRKEIVDAGDKPPSELLPDGTMLLKATSSSND